MKKLLVSISLAFGLLFAGDCLTAQAETYGVYVTPKVFLNIQGTEYGITANNLSVTSEDTYARAGGGIAVGYDFFPRFSFPLRVELEYLKQGDISLSRGLNNSSIPSGLFPRTSSAPLSINGKMTLESSTLLFNVYYDIKNSTKFTPYFGVGIGMAFLGSDVDMTASAHGVNGNRSISETNTVFAAQFGIGCSYAFTENISAEIGYRYLMMGDTSVSTTIQQMPVLRGVKMEFENKRNYAHQIMLGVRFTF